MRDDSDDHLVRYLLGELPDDESERLDERSIADDEFALRLRAIENDLIDRFARGERFDSTLERFDRVYRTSPHLREKVNFARALSTLTARDEPGLARAPIRQTFGRLSWRNLAAAAGLVLAVAAGYLALRDLRLRDEVGQLENRRAAIESENAELRQELERARGSAARPRSPAVATFLLPPPRRSLGNDSTTVSLPRGAEQVTLRLQVESDQYATFWVALRDTATNRIVWRSADLSSETAGSDRIVSITVPAGVLSAQGYSVELTGVSSGGLPEVVGRYAVRVVLE